MEARFITMGEWSTTVRDSKRKQFDVSSVMEVYRTILKRPRTVLAHQYSAVEPGTSTPVTQPVPEQPDTSTPSEREHLSPKQPSTSSQIQLVPEQPGTSSHIQMVPEQPSTSSHIQLVSEYPSTRSHIQLVSKQPSTSSQIHLAPKHLDTCSQIHELHPVTSTLMTAAGNSWTSISQPRRKTSSRKNQERSKMTNMERLNIVRKTLEMRNIYGNTLEMPNNAEGTLEMPNNAGNTLEMSNNAEGTLEMSNNTGDTLACVTDETKPVRMAALVPAVKDKPPTTGKRRVAIKRTNRTFVHTPKYVPESVKGALHSAGFYSVPPAYAQDSVFVNFGNWYSSQGKYGIKYSRALKRMLYHMGGQRPMFQSDTITPNNYKAFLKFLEAKGADVQTLQWHSRTLRHFLLYYKGDPDVNLKMTSPGEYDRLKQVQDLLVQRRNRGLEKRAKQQHNRRKAVADRAPEPYQVNSLLRVAQQDTDKLLEKASKAKSLTRTEVAHITSYICAYVCLRHAARPSVLTSLTVQEYEAAIRNNRCVEDGKVYYMLTIAYHKTAGTHDGCLIIEPAWKVRLDAYLKYVRAPIMRKSGATHNRFMVLSNGRVFVKVTQAITTLHRKYGLRAYNNRDSRRAIEQSTQLHLSLPQQAMVAEYLCHSEKTRDGFYRVPNAQARLKIAKYIFKYNDCDSLDEEENRDTLDGEEPSSTIVAEANQTSNPHDSNASTLAQEQPTSTLEKESTSTLATEQPTSTLATEQWTSTLARIERRLLGTTGEPTFNRNDNDSDALGGATAREKRRQTRATRRLRTLYNI